MSLCVSEQPWTIWPVTSLDIQTVPDESSGSCWDVERGGQDLRSGWLDVSIQVSGCPYVNQALDHTAFT